jgi:hypothetical protein
LWTYKEYPIFEGDLALAIVRKLINSPIDLIEMRNFSLKLYKWSLKSAITNVELVPDSVGRITLDSLSTSFPLNYYPTYSCSP